MKVQSLHQKFGFAKTRTTHRNKIKIDNEMKSFLKKGNIVLWFKNKSLTVYIFKYIYIYIYI